MTTTVMIVMFETTLSSGGRPPAALERIVVPLDGSELSRSALVPAEELARRTGARLELLSTKVAEGPTEPSSFLDELADEITGRGSPIEVRTSIRMEGDPVEAIGAVVEQDTTPALIVMSSHGRGRIRRAALGSTAESVVSSGVAPVLVTGPSFAPSTFSNDGPVLVTHDGTHEPDRQMIATLAGAASGQITVLQVFHPEAHLPGRPRSGLLVSDAAAEFAGELRAVGFDVMTQAAQALKASRAIVDVAEDLDSSIVVVTSRSRTGTERAVLGSVAADVVRSSPVPVLISRSS
ncbi:MAG: universal stress protein [Acidimicrobiales bacterium]